MIDVAMIVTVIVLVVLAMRGVDATTPLDDPDTPRDPLLVFSCARPLARWDRQKDLPGLSRQYT